MAIRRTTPAGTRLPRGWHSNIMSFFPTCAAMATAHFPSRAPTTSISAFRDMARDLIEVMEQLGYQRFMIAGHDRGGRTTHRLCLDQPNRIIKACIMDVVPNYHVWTNITKNWVIRTWHWGFMAQPEPFPERLISAVPAEYFLKSRMAIRGGTGVGFLTDTATIIAAFREHLVDAYVNVTSLFLAMEENKTGRVLAPVSQYEGKLAVGTLYATKRLIDTDPNTVRAFVAGWIETIEFILTHKAETVKIESEITGFSESVMSRDYDLTIGMFTKDCKFDAESLATLKRSFVDLKLLATPPDMSALYTEAFLPK